VTGVILSEKAHPVAAALRKEDGALLEEVNAAIDKMRSNGTLAAIIKKWFGDANVMAP
jgi:ABC-type amino acid transport substrate-binding protein